MRALRRRCIIPVTVQRSRCLRAGARARAAAMRSTSAEIWIPDGREPAEAWRGVTHLAVGAHPDDVEFMAFHGIQLCYDRPAPGFAAIICTDGARSPRAGDYTDCLPAELVRRRAQEQRRAARLGRFAALARLSCSSPEARRGAPELAAGLRELLSLCRPEILYMHSPFDRHPTHAAVARMTVAALRQLPAAARPQRLYGCEVWGGLDWLPERRKVFLDISTRQDLAAELIAVYESQLSPAKRYDRAVPARWQANATFHEWDKPDTCSHAALAVDLTPLLGDESPGLARYVEEVLAEHRAAVAQRLAGGD